MVSHERCCGCSACASMCPRNCIDMIQDPEGFLIPKIDTSKCVHCNLCESVCPVTKQDAERIPNEWPQVYAGYNLDQDIRRASSSGGIFSAIAEEILKTGGWFMGLL